MLSGAEPQAELLSVVEQIAPRPAIAGPDPGTIHTASHETIDNDREAWMISGLLPG